MVLKFRCLGHLIVLLEIISGKNLGWNTFLKIPNGPLSLIYSQLVLLYDIEIIAYQGVIWKDVHFPSKYFLTNFWSKSPFFKHKNTVFSTYYLVPLRHPVLSVGHTHCRCCSCTHTYLLDDIMYLPTPLQIVWLAALASLVEAGPGLSRAR